MDKEEIKIYDDQMKSTGTKADILKRFDEKFDSEFSFVGAMRGTAFVLNDAREFLSDAIDEAAKAERERVCNEIKNTLNQIWLNTSNLKYNKGYEDCRKLVLHQLEKLTTVN